MIDPELLDLCVRVPFLSGDGLRRPVDFIADADDGGILLGIGQWWSSPDTGVDPLVDYAQGYGRLRRLDPEEGAGWGLESNGDLYTICPADSEDDGRYAERHRNWTLLNRAVYLAALRRAFGELPHDLAPWIARIKAMPVPSLLPRPRRVATVDALDVETGDVIDRLAVAEDGGAAVRNSLPFFLTCAEQWAQLPDDQRPSPDDYAKTLAEMAHANLAFVSPEGMISDKALEAVVQAQPLGLPAATLL